MLRTIMSNPIVINSGSESEITIPERNNKARDAHEPDNKRQELNSDEVSEDLDPYKV